MRGRKGLEGRLSNFELLDQVGEKRLGCLDLWWFLERRLVRFFFFLLLGCSFLSSLGLRWDARAREKERESIYHMLIVYMVQFSFLLLHPFFVTSSFYSSFFSLRSTLHRCHHRHSHFWH